MDRIHLFELEDFDWVPDPIRDGGTLSAWRLLPSAVRQRVSLTPSDLNPSAAGIARVDALSERKSP